MPWQSVPFTLFNIHISTRIFLYASVSKWQEMESPTWSNMQELVCLFFFRRPFVLFSLVMFCFVSVRFVLFCFNSMGRDYLSMRAVIYLLVSKCARLPRVGRRVELVHECMYSRAGLFDLSCVAYLDEVSQTIRRPTGRDETICGPFSNEWKRNRCTVKWKWKKARLNFYQWTIKPGSNTLPANMKCSSIWLLLTNMKYSSTWLLSINIKCSNIFTFARRTKCSINSQWTVSQKEQRKTSVQIL